MNVRLEANQPFFYIMLPSYNRSERVMQAVKSVLEQDYSHYHLMIFNDGSSQNYATLSQYIRQFDQVQYLYSQHNIGVNAARNIMLEQMLKMSQHRNSYFFTLSDDDYLLPDALRTMANEIRQLRQPWYSFNCISKSQDVFENRDYRYYMQLDYADFKKHYQGDKHFVFKLKCFKQLRYPAHHFKNGYEHIFYYQIPYPMQVIPKPVKVIEYLPDGLSLSNLYDHDQSFQVLIKHILAAPKQWVFYLNLLQFLSRPKNILISLLSERGYYQLKKSLGLKGARRNKSTVK